MATFDQSDQEVAAILKRAQTEGELRADLDPQATAQLLLCATQGMALRSRVMGDGQPHPRARGAILRLLAPGSSFSRHTPYSEQGCTILAKLCPLHPPG